MSNPGGGMTTGRKIAFQRIADAALGHADNDVTRAVSPDLAPVIPAPSPPRVAGWLELKKQTQGIDWKLVNCLGGNAVKVIVQGKNSPASRAGMRTDDYVLSISNASFEEFHERTPRVGTHVPLKIYREGVGELLFDAKLAKPPHAYRRRAPKPKPPAFPVPCGQVLDHNERLKWLDLVSSKTYLSTTAKALATRIVSGYLNRHQGRAWPAQATLARDLNVSVATVQRAIRELVGDGLLSVRSKKSSGQSNDYVPTGQRRSILRRWSGSPSIEAQANDETRSSTPAEFTAVIAQRSCTGTGNCTTAVC